MVRVWTVQHPKAYEEARAAQPEKMLRASPSHLENDFAFKFSYEFMAEQLASRVGPCPEDCLKSWRARGGTSELPAPVWVWQNAYGGDRKEKLPESYGAGSRSVMIEAEVPADAMLPSQFGAWHAVLNDSAITLNEEEDDELETLKANDREAWERRKAETWLRVFQVDWEGEAYNLAHRDEVEVQAVLWELPMKAIVRAQRSVDLGLLDGNPSRMVKVVYSSARSSDDASEACQATSTCTIGEDMELSIVWRKKKQHIPSRNLWIRVLKVREGGLAASQGVGENWELLAIENDYEAAGDPLPRLPVLLKDDKFETEVGPDDTDDSEESESEAGEAARKLPKEEVGDFPVSAELILEDILKLSDVVAVFQPPPEPDSDSD